VPITLTATAGTLDVIYGTTGPDGTLAVQQAEGVLGDTITATCAEVTAGSPYFIISGTTRSVAAADTVITWFDESRRLFNAAVVLSVTKVLAASSNFNFSTVDHSSDYSNLTLQKQNASQSAAGPAQVEVLQGTFSSLDCINVDETTVTGNPNGSMTFASNPPNRYLNAFAVDGASPTVCAVVTDAKGVGVAGASVSVTCTAGEMIPATAVTDDNGTAFFYQANGTLGDTLTVRCDALPETSPVNILTGASAAQTSGDRMIAWFERKPARFRPRS